MRRTFLPVQLLLYTQNEAHKTHGVHKQNRHMGTFLCTYKVWYTMQSIPRVHAHTCSTSAWWVKTPPSNRITQPFFYFYKPQTQVHSSSSLKVLHPTFPSLYSPNHRRNNPSRHSDNRHRNHPGLILKFAVRPLLHGMYTFWCFFYFIFSKFVFTSLVPFPPALPTKYCRTGCNAPLMWRKKRWQNVGDICVSFMHMWSKLKFSV